MIAERGYTLSCHVETRKRVIAVEPSGGGYTLSVDGVGGRHAHSLAQAESWALEEVRSYFAEHLAKSDSRWGLRLAIPCGTFDFGDWSFEPLMPGSGFPDEEPILQLYRKWRERGGPQSAMSGARALVRYCLGGNVSAVAAAA